MAPATHAGSPEFVVLMIADNLHLTQAQLVPGLKVLPLSGASLGTDLAGALNDVLAQLNFRMFIDLNAWQTNMQRFRPSAVLHAERVQAASANAAMAHTRRLAHQLLDLLALRRGATPRLLAGVVGRREANGVASIEGSWIEGSGYTGNLLGGVISGEGQRDLITLWNGLTADARIQLWLSLYADAIADERWEYRLFRCFNLLEGIASELVPAGQAVLDPAGAPLLQPNGRAYTTDQARGKTYQLLAEVARANNESEANFTAPVGGQPSDLWTEIEIWVAVRNAVAHRGTWELPAGFAVPQRHADVEAAIKARGHDGTFEAGIEACIRAVRSAVTSTLFATIRGRI